MSQFTQQGQALIQDIAARHGFSEDAAQSAFLSVAQGGGTMAQFGHPELGGMGQWSQGGMLMIGDMFNNYLKGRVDGLLNDLANAYFQGGMIEIGPGSSGQWWPSDLGSPSSTGGQNDMRYAVFPGARRLAVERGGQVTVYDTGDHMIGGVQQQSGGEPSFSSQFGTVYPSNLPVVSGSAPQQGGQSFAPQYQASGQSQFQSSGYAPQSQPDFAPVSQPGSSPMLNAEDDIISALERLGGLRDKGILTDDEFASKKAELLSRL